MRIPIRKKNQKGLIAFQNYQQKKSQTLTNPLVLVFSKIQHSGYNKSLGKNLLISIVITH